MSGIGVDLEFIRDRIPQSRAHPDMVLQLFTDPDSRVIGCSVVFPEETEEDEDFYCRRPMGHRTGFPAMGPDGRAAYGLARVRVVERLNRDFERTPADLEIFVSALPGDRTRLDILLMAYIDETGQVRLCQRGSADPTLARIACEQAAGHVFSRRFGRGGEAVPHVANLTVAFLTEMPAD
jgi:hypothetical protein